MAAVKPWKWVLLRNRGPWRRGNCRATVSRVPGEKSLDGAIVKMYDALDEADSSAQKSKSADLQETS